MTPKSQPPYFVDSISKLHTLLDLRKPKHPLLSVINLAELDSWPTHIQQSVAHQFYCITIFRNFDASIKHGQRHDDFDSSVMTFSAPRQSIEMTCDSFEVKDGFVLIVHPEYFQNYPLAQRIKAFGFFSYNTRESLHLSEQEDHLVMEIIRLISREIDSPIDAFSQDLIVSHTEVLLNYANRFYNRQFITRKLANSDLVARLDNLLNQYFQGDTPATRGLPTVHYIASELNLSPNYLSDILRVTTGMTAKQHIQNRLIEKAKQILATTLLPVSEIAYLLGFEYSQSFNKLFKSKTSLSPLKYRQSVN